MRNLAKIQMSPKHVLPPCNCYHYFVADTVTADDGGHDVIDNFEFPCNSMENLISIWNFTDTVIKDVK